MKPVRLISKSDVAFTYCKSKLNTIGRVKVLCVCTSYFHGFFHLYILFLYAFQNTFWIKIAPLSIDALTLLSLTEINEYALGIN